MMGKLVIETAEYREVLQHALKVDPAAFYVGRDARAVSGGSLTAHCCEEGVVITSNRLPERELRKLFARFLPGNEGASPKT